MASLFEHALLLENFTRKRPFPPRIVAHARGEDAASIVFAVFLGVFNHLHLSVVWHALFLKNTENHDFGVFKFGGRSYSGK